jgi:hypothetical protein
MNQAIARAVEISPWLSAEELAVYVRCLSHEGAPSAEAARKWAKRHGVVAAHRGRCVLYARADVEAALTGGLRLVHGRRVAGHREVR